MKALILSFSRKKGWKGISYVQIVFGRDMFFLLLGGWVCYSPLQFIHDERNFGVLESQANKVTNLQHWRHFFSHRWLTSRWTNKQTIKGSIKPSLFMVRPLWGDWLTQSSLEGKIFFQGGSSSDLPRFKGNLLTKTWFPPNSFSCTPKDTEADVKMVWCK